MGCARRQRIGRCHHTLLVSPVRAGRSDTGGHHGHVGPDDLTHRPRLEGRGHDAAHARIACLARPTRHELGNRNAIAGIIEIGLIHRGEDGDAQQAERRPFGCLDCSRHRLGIGMEREHGRAGFGNGRDALCNRVVDIEELEVEKHALAGPEQFLAHDQPVAAIEKLIADLVEIDDAIEPGNHVLGFTACPDIEPDNQVTGHSMSPRALVYQGSMP